LQHIEIPGTVLGGPPDERDSISFHNELPYLGSIGGGHFAEEGLWWGLDGQAMPLAEGTARGGYNPHVPAPTCHS
jgi:hypothetical protein